MSDLNEFKAGTNPLDPASVFKGTALNPTQAGTAILQWGSIPGRHYQVQYKDDLNLENWINLNQQVTATSASTEVTDLRANESIRRYYRIIVLP